jgi:hypothetical protein
MVLFANKLIFYRGQMRNAVKIWQKIFILFSEYYSKKKEYVHDILFPGINNCGIWVEYLPPDKQVLDYFTSSKSTSCTSSVVLFCSAWALG